MNTVMILLLLVLLAIQLGFLFVLFSFAITLFFGAPWVPTHASRARKMLAFAGLQPGETVLDLGSGDGAILFCAVEEFRAYHAIGYEINPVLIIIARLRARLRKLVGQVTTVRRNIFKDKFPNVDVVTTFLIPSTMKKLRVKLAAMPTETRIISRGFMIPGVTPSKKQEGPDEWLYLYKPDDLK
jgi:SAM-dependent methyltransferase